MTTHEILYILYHYGPQTAKEIAHWRNKSRTMASQRLNIMHKRGLVSREWVKRAPGGFYRCSITKKGLDLLEFYENYGCRIPHCGCKES